MLAQLHSCLKSKRFSETTRPRCCSIECKTIPKETLHLPGPDFVDRSLAGSDRPTRVLTSLQALLNHGRLARDRLRLDPAGRSGHRAFGRRVVRAEPGVLRSREHREARDRRRLQRRRVHARRARRRRAQVRAQDSVPAQVQPQRVPLLSEQLRSDPLRQRQAGVRHGCGGRRRDDLLRVRGIEAPAAGSDRDVPAGARASGCSPSSGATCGIRRSRRRRPTITWPPISRARRIISA